MPNAINDDQEKLLNRFLSGIKEKKGCWIWGRAISKSGYGYIKVYRKQRYAHRLSYMLFNGTIPTGLVIDHKCKVRSCVNPAHLRLVTPIENVLLNSVCPTALNKIKTHCKYGHEFTAENTYYSITPSHPNGYRKCKICRKQYNKKTNDNINLHLINALEVK